MKVAFVTQVFNGGFFLKQVLENLKGFGESYVVEGCVGYWADKYPHGSTDETMEIIRKAGCDYLSGGAYKEKTEQFAAVKQLIPDDVDYLWIVSADEFYHREDMQKVMDFLDKERPNSVSFLPYTFWTGFNYFVGGFEHNHSNRRIIRYDPTAEIVDHRPPMMAHGTKELQGWDVTGQEIVTALDVYFYHYSYVSPLQVYQKSQYYQNHLIKDAMIPDWFEDVWLAWTRAVGPTRTEIEDRYKGVQEFTHRSAAYTETFMEAHPIIISHNKPKYFERIRKEMEEVNKLRELDN